MSALFLAFLLLPPTDGDSTRRLRHCTDRRDRACVISELQSPPRHKSAEYWSAAAEAYLLLGRQEDARTAIKNAVQNKPDDYSLLIQQGRVFQRCGMQVEAIESFLLAASKNPTSEAFYWLGLSFFLAHEYERADKHFHHAIQLDDKNHKAEFMLAVIDVLKNYDVESAKAHLERALAIEPNNSHYVLHYGAVLSELNDPRAIPVLERGVSLNPSNPLAHFNLGRAYRRVGNLPRARKELELAVRLRPYLARAHYQLGAVYRSLGEKEKARRAMQEFVKFQDLDQDDDPVDGPPSYAFQDRLAK
jgi:tetratricopeptide (TPR) repeat protein